MLQRLIFSIFLLMPLTLQAQDQSTDFPFFNTNAEIPESILKNRSVVFTSLDALNWSKQAEELHQYFVESGVDAVAYYALSDILSGKDATTAFYSDLLQRGIEHFIIFHKGESDYHLYVGNINPDKGLFWNNMPVYHQQNASIKELGRSFSYKIEQKRLERQNFLIIDVPEIFKNTSVIKTRRVENFNPDARIDRLAVPKFEESVVFDFDVDKANQQLDSIFKNFYPFEYKLVDPNLTDEEIINEGCLIVLKRLYNKGESLKRMLGYSIPENETIMISVRQSDPETIKKFSIDEMLYKYYMQQLYTKDIYLGKEWDADDSWQEALINHIENLKSSLQKK